MQRTVYSGATSVADSAPGLLHGVFEVQAGDVAQVQYVVASGTSSTFGSGTMDGEAMVTSALTLFSIDLY